MASGREPRGRRGVRGKLRGAEEVKLAGQAVALGLDGMALLHEADPVALLAAQAVTAEAARVRHELDRNLAAEIVDALAKALSKG